MSDIYTDPPQSRNEAIIKSTIDGTQYTAPPQSRMEDLLLELKEVIEQGGGGGTSDYSQLTNKPSINDVTLSGNKTSTDLGLMPEYEVDTTPTESSENLITSGGVWSADKNINDKLQGSKVVEGNPITITDAEPMNAESVVVELEPKQDLHGYDKPWAGGAGKNLLPMTVDGIKTLNSSYTWVGNLTTINNAKINILTDSANNVTGISISGTPNANVLNILLGIITTTSTTILTGFSGDWFANGLVLHAYEQGTASPEYITGGTGSVELPANKTYEVSISLKQDVVRNDTIYPMIRLSTETDADFEPYSNICPISGYSEVNVERDGDTYTIDLDGTKYGGTLDVTEGGYSDEWGTHTLDYVSLEDGLFTASAPNNVKGDVFAQAKCNRMKTWASVDDLDDNYGIAYSNNTFYMKLPPECGTTASEVDDWLGENPVSVVYLKKTPSSVSTTPTDIALLENTNNISTDGTNITLKYQPNNVIGECKKYTDEKCAKVLPQPPTTDGTYHLSCEVTSGVGELSWVSDS